MSRLTRFAEVLFYVNLGFIIGFMAFSSLDYLPRYAIAFGALVVNAIVHTVLLDRAGAFA